MLEFLDGIIRTISSYKSQDCNRNIFTEISEAFYRENYHSDIFSYYLSFDIAKNALIDWINEQLNKDEVYVDYHAYTNGAVKREDGRIDITLYSYDKTRAIIIENKSNDATDQDRQLPRYIEDLKRQNIRIDGILYLNKNHIREPNTTGWSIEEITEIKSKLVVSQLVGENSFLSKVIEKALYRTTDIRLSALSHEIKSLLQNLVFGGINMEDLTTFVQELTINNNFEKLQKAIQAYNDLPKYWRELYKNFLDSEKNKGQVEINIHIGIFQDTCLFLDNIVIEKINYAFDIWFRQDFFEFSILTRNGSQSQIDELRKKMKEKWFFTDNFERGRYRKYFKDVLNEKEMKEQIMKAIDSFKPFI